MVKKVIYTEGVHFLMFFSQPQGGANRNKMNESIFTVIELNNNIKEWVFKHFQMAPPWGLGGKRPIKASSFAFYIYHFT